MINTEREPGSSVAKGRRRIVAVLLLVCVRVSAQCGETEPQGEGPYYRVGSPERSDLVVAGDTPLFTLHGRVLDTDCQPIPGCWVDVWHTDMDGSYDFSPDYRYRGHFFTDADGEFVMETIIPGVYPGRTPHIHIKVEGANTPLLTTQLYFPDHPLNPADLFYDADLEVTPIEWLPSGGLVASFEFNLSSDCTAPTVASDPESSSYPEGDVAVLSIEATGSEVLEFRWRRDGVELADGGAWVGTGTDTLTIVDVAPSHAGTYDCLVSNACGATASEAAVITVGAPESFVRGDCSADGDHDLGDPITLLDSVFSGGTPPGCADACDGNDDGTVDVADAVFLLSFLFSSGPDPAAPFPDCGDDLTSDLVGCHWYAACP